MTYPSFVAGEVLRATDVNAIGCWLVKSQLVGAGVSSVAVTGAFSSDYDVYKVVYDGGTCSAFTTIAMQLGASVTGYNMSLPYVTYGAAAPAGTSVLNASSFSLMGAGDTNYAGVDVDVLSPNLARFTRVQGAYIANSESGSYTGIHKVATAYTGFTLIATGGTLVGGNISVFGYKR
jgi:hypothetical protein